MLVPFQDEAPKGTGRACSLMREMTEMNYLQTSPLVPDDSALRGLLGEIKKTLNDDGICQCTEAAKQSSQTR